MAYLRVRDMLRTDPGARERYEIEKQRLATTHAEDRRAYTAGKAGTVAALLDGTA